MATAIDVLAVMDDLHSDYKAAATYTGEWCYGVDDDLIAKSIEARAAVAELIRLAENAELVIRNCANAGQIGAGYMAHADDLRAALARCKGETA